MKRLLSLLLSVLFLSLSATALDRATLFVGDNVWQGDALMPFIETNGKSLLPVSAFSEFGIKVTLSERAGSLLLSRDDRYLSFSLGLGKVLDENGLIRKTEIYRYGGEIYLEPALVCEKFALMFTTVYASDGYLAARLTDGGETIEFADLLNMHSVSAEKEIPFLYNPEGKTVAGSFMYPIAIKPAVQNVKGTVASIRNKSITFAISPGDIADYGEVLPLIFAAGHTVAFFMDKDSDPDVFKAEMQNANEWLFAFIGKTSKVYVSADTEKNTPDIDGFFKKCCNIHLTKTELASENTVNRVLLSGAVNCNFSISTDYASRIQYNAFFNRFDSHKNLAVKQVSESSPIK
nr:hypothetical protein [Clostridia bacterium]